MGYRVRILLFYKSMKLPGSIPEMMESKASCQMRHQSSKHYHYYYHKGTSLHSMKYKSALLADETYPWTTRSSQPLEKTHNSRYSSDSSIHGNCIGVVNTLLLKTLINMYQSSSNVVKLITIQV